MKHFLILSLCLILCSCTFDQTIEYKIDPLLQPYMDSFYTEALKRDYHYDKYNLIVQLKPNLSNSSDAWGLSEKIGDQRVVSIDQELYNDYTRGNHQDRIEAIFFHEMGHALLYRHHNSCQESLMNPFRLGSGDIFETSSSKVDSVFRSKLIDELFAANCK